MVRETRVVKAGKADTVNQKLMIFVKQHVQQSFNISLNMSEPQEAHEPAGAPFTNMNYL